MDWTLRVTDLAIIGATILGPVLAVQAQKWIERSRSVKSRREAIFRVLMATRATRLSINHVEALNAIPVEFYGIKGDLKTIQEKWKSYQDLLNKSDLEATVLADRRNAGFIDLLFDVSKYLGYAFGRSELQNNVYYPTGHADVETDQIIIRRGLSLLFQGKISIPMAVKEFPSSAEPSERQEQVAKLLVEWLEGTRTVQVSQT